MSGLKIVKKDDAIMNVLSKVGSFSLKAKDDNLEVVYIEANAGKSLFLHPYECENAMYLFYILSGVINYTKDKMLLKAGDCISAKNLKETEYFEISEDVKMLMITQKPFFDHQADYAVKMSDEMNKIQQKDAYTEEHCNRTGNLSLKIGIQLGLVNEALNDLLFASKVHDLGKINVPIEILNKPGKYEDFEFDIMKRHPKDGYDMIKDSVSKKEALIVLQHHEKCNGSGYPYGILKEDMLIESRILAVADAFDALISERSYRKALRMEEALSILDKDRGVLWDEQVLDALNAVLIEM